jgi:hypothetical protein
VSIIYSDYDRQRTGATDARYVLRFPGPLAHVHHGRFWPDAGAVLGEFLWDAWLINKGGSYFISDGYGGAHALLWGFGGESTAMTGNVWNGSASQSFTGNYAPGPLEWVHLAVGLKGGNLYTYVNGVPDSISAFSGTRVAAAWGGGAGVLFVGGSDHLNWIGDLALVRGWDRGLCPLTTETSFIPERFPSRFSNGVPCDFYCDYTVKDFPFDLSPAGAEMGNGYAFHHGRLAHPNAGGSSAAYETDAYPIDYVISPLPAWVASTNCPYLRPLGETSPVEDVPAPAAVPGGALAFDSFGRANQTFAFQTAPSLGSTEGGSLGPLAWQTSRIQGQPTLGLFGILGGAAVNTNAAAYSTAWVPVGTEDMDVRVTRQKSASLPGQTGVAFRVVDANNYWSAYYITSGADAGGNVYLAKVVAGVISNVTNYAVGGGSWTVLRVVASGDTFTVYRDDGSGGWTQLGQATGITDHLTGEGAGISNNNGFAVFSNLARWKNFTVFAA